MGLVEFISQWFSLNELLYQRIQWQKQLGCITCDTDKEDIKKRLEYIEESIKQQLPKEFYADENKLRHHGLYHPGIESFRYIINAGPKVKKRAEIKLRMVFQLKRWLQIQACQISPAFINI